LVLGDLNAYAKEDPIRQFTDNGFVNLIYQFGGDEAYSYSFGGQVGYLDHALANANLSAKAVDAVEWHINASEPRVLDYNVEFKSEAQIIDFYAPDANRMSDHDPVIVSFELNAPPVCDAAVSSKINLWPVNHKFHAIDVVGVTDPDGDVVTINIDSIFQDEMVGKSDADGKGVGTSTAMVKAERDGKGNGRMYHITYTATDTAEQSCSGVVKVDVPKSQGKKGAAVDGGAMYDSTISQ
jgi:hypothetical protein